MNSSRLVAIITAADAETRDRSVDSFCRDADLATLLAETEALEAFRHASPNLYERVRALFFLHAIHRFHLPARLEGRGAALVPHGGYEHLLSRRFSEAIASFLAVQRTAGPSDAISSALALAYRDLGLQTLADQVRRSVRSLRGNQWMFRIGHPAEQPLRVRPELLTPGPDGTFPVLRESTPVRMDLSHAGWSDIFFLGMDYPEGARVLNVSIDLAVHGRDPRPRPPVEACFRVIDSPVLRLTSVDLGATAEISDLAEIFDFARDYLGLLKAAVIAAGIVPPGVEGSGVPLGDLLERLVGPGRGLELVSNVNGIPKGSRLAVSTNLLASLIAVCMRATGQAAGLTGGLSEPERRLVAARAILGEWLGGSGGGWQDSGGVWPAAKLIRGVVAAEGDPEFGTSRGRLLPRHEPVPIGAALQESLVLVHGGMAQNVGPILEMVTEKYLLRSDAEWEARREAGLILDEIIAAVAAGDVRRVAAATTDNFRGPIQTIIPWATNLYTETLITEVQRRFGDRFWGFWMLGGMSGGGMGFIVDPTVKTSAQAALAEIMAAAKLRLEGALPFAMDPVVYDFAVNDHGTWCELLSGGSAALLPPGYYKLTVPDLLRADHHRLSPGRRSELDAFGAACRTDPEFSGMIDTLFERLFPRGDAAATGVGLRGQLAELGFDAVQHEQIRADLIAGRIGLAQNRLLPSTTITDVTDDDVVRADVPHADPDLAALGSAALSRGAVAVVTLAAGAGSRWTQGAGVVKALHPFCRLAGRHRSFLEVHLAKSRRTGRLHSMPLPHVVTTSWLTHRQIVAAGLPVVLSPGRSVGLRLVPMARDLDFAWRELAHQRLDEQKQKMRESQQAALLGWARQMGEGSDYTANVPHQCLHPVGHWYEIPNMLLNGVLAGLITERPHLRWLFLHNIDTVGADVDPAILGRHIAGGGCLSLEVIQRRIEDRGGGLARVNGRPRLVEGLAMPREEVEFGLRYYNTLSTWIDIDRLLAVFGLSREDLLAADAGARTAAAVRRVAARMPTYVTLKEVKRRWGQGQEDVLPVAQFEKLWGDMTALPEVDCRFFVVPRLRGQQLKDVAQLDGWLRDGSAVRVERLGDWD
ncbi:MAG: UTP--glucose-1-phosphate uridylyltransferase [Planctomycetia bacterium]|nr:UTP--glucose-1-phosphate uridylyltransferase [Planctomycetia bacterium]